MNRQKKWSGLFIGAAFLLAGAAGLWLAYQEYIRFLDGLGLMSEAGLSLRLSLGLVGLEGFLAIILLAIAWVIWQPAQTARLQGWVIRSRARFGLLNWLLAVIIILIPLWLMLRFQLSEGIGPTARLILTLGMGLAIAILICRNSSRLVDTPSLILAWLLIASIFAFGQAFSAVSSYPFSLTWSEGNRFWDYSARFGHRFYNYPADEPIFAYIDLGRQLLWGLPFAFARIPIWFMRLWNGLVSTLPYAVLGWLAFQRLHAGAPPTSDDIAGQKGEQSRLRALWFLCGLWTFLFLNQGPIYTPLVLSAWLVALAWRRSLWLALPLVALAGYYAAATRFTWMFAPAIWAGMVYFIDLPERRAQPVRTDETGVPTASPPLRWGASVAVFLAGILGGYVVPNRTSLVQLARQLFEPAPALPGTTGQGINTATPAGLGEILNRQPLLWERLLPNPTFGPGILLALAIAVLPLIIFLIYLVKKRLWPLDFLRGLTALLPLLAFLVVGLIASVKIGGGGDLHNMDMFLVTLVFVAALAWRAGGYRAILHIDKQPPWVQGVWVLMVIIFAQQSMLGATPLRFPSAAKTKEALEFVQRQAAMASEQGEVLFLDQRQLLTFGDVPSFPLVVDYEKKYLMDQALSNDADYFAKFHADLAKRRFALIISEPLKVVYQGDKHHFGNENDAWVKWVAEPILCYYEPLKTFREVKVQLLTPRANPEACP